MQKEIKQVIVKFFEGNLSRKPTPEEIQQLHDQLTVDYESTYEYAIKSGTPVDTLLTLQLTSRYRDEMKNEHEAFSLATNFNTTANVVTMAISKFKEAAEAIVNSDHCSAALNMIVAGDTRVTLLEPALLKVRLEEAFSACHDACLKDLVLRKDPTLSREASDGVAWHADVIATGRVTVNHIKRVREIFHPSVVDIKDGKRIVELVLEGKIKC